MGIRIGRNIGVPALLAILAVLVVLGACSGSDPAATPVDDEGQAGPGANSQERDGSPADDESATPVARTADEWCATGARRIVDRFEGFLGVLPDISPEDFLDLEEIDGLAAFQNDVARIISETTSQNSTLCDLDGLQDLVAAELATVEREGVLAEFLVTIIRDGRELTTADLAVEPGDDVAAVLALLDHGSTLTFAPGTHVVERPLIVERSITFLGAGVGSTTVESDAADAAIVVAGQGELIMREMRVEHTGSAPASVVLSFDRRVDLQAVELAGGVSDADGGAGNGLVLADQAFGQATSSDGSAGAADASGDNAATVEEKPRSVVVASAFNDNAGAGLAVSGALAPDLVDSEFRGNGICGLCYFGAAAGEVVNAQIAGNDFGIQVADTSAPLISRSTISDNSTAGVVVIGSARATILESDIDANGEIGVAVQEEASAEITDNRLTANPFGISVLSPANVQVLANQVVGGEIALQIGERAMPVVTGNRFADTTAIAVAVAGDAAPRLVDNRIEPADGVGLATEERATLDVEGLRVDGGVVALAFAGSSGGSISGGEFTDQQIGIQLDEMAQPVVEDVEILRPETAGVVARGSTAAVLDDIRVVDAGEVGFVVADESVTELNRVSVRGGLSGASIVGTSTARIEEGWFEDLEVGIQVAEDASPTLIGNDVVDARAAAFVFIGQASGTAERNRVQRPGIVGMQLGDSAEPRLQDNVLLAAPPEADPDVEGLDDPTTGEPSAEDLVAPDLISPGDVGEGDEGDEAVDEGADDVGEIAATVGILYAGESGGSATRNQMVGFVIGIQVGGTAAPDLVDNVIDGGSPVGVGVLYRDAGSGTASGNETSRHAVGFQVGDESTPTLESNRVSTARNVAFLVQGAAAPELFGNSCPEGLAGIGMLDGLDPVREANDCLEVRSE